MLYTAENGSLAILEVLQYAEVTDIRSFSMLTLEVPGHVEIDRIPLESLPINWQHFPHLSATKDIGQYWVEQGRALLLHVPSAVYPDESNLLINPKHPDAGLVNIVSVKPFQFSERLF